ncbi:MAG TPA: FMN-binding protein [bacterium]|nr:FMN-binding protein [bacterium]
MGKYIQMIVVLAAISLVSGLSLGALNSLTEELAKNNVLRFKKIPAVISLKEIISGQLSADQQSRLADELLAQKKEIALEDGKPLVFFVLKKDERPFAVAFDVSGKGYGGGEVAIMAGFNLEDGNLVGIGPAVVDQTPGVGTRIREDSFTMQFRGLGLNTAFKIKKDGGTIDAVSGATLSSRAAARDVAQAVEIFKRNEQRIRQAAGL